MKLQYRPLGRDEPLVLVIDGAILPEVSVRRATALSPRVALHRQVNATTLAEARVVYTEEAEFDATQTRQLRLVQGKSASIAYLLDIQGLPPDVPVANVRGAFTPAVAEQAVGMLLSLTRRFTHVFAQQQRCRWSQTDPELRRETGVCFGKTVGFVGYGSIGRHIARILHGMGMSILAGKRDPRCHPIAAPVFRDFGDPAGELPRDWFGPLDLSRMAAQCHVLVNTLPGTDHTFGLINRQVLEALPRGAVFVNVGRGGVVDEAALIEGLHTGHLAGAGMDVFEQEPLPSDHPFWSMPNVIVSPHIGSASGDQLERAADVLIENLKRLLHNRPLVNVVNLNRGY